jgi:hypothetical protein
VPHANPKPTIHLAFWLVRQKQLSAVGTKNRKAILGLLIWVTLNNESIYKSKI